jgi:translation initiation factor IF-2
MTETKHPGEKLTVAPTKATLSLKRPGVEQGVVKQSFSHGRTKAVVVEKVKSRRGLSPRRQPRRLRPPRRQRRPCAAR